MAFTVLSMSLLDALSIGGLITSTVRKISHLSYNTSTSSNLDPVVVKYVWPTTFRSLGRNPCKVSKYKRIADNDHNEPIVKFC